MAWLKKILHFFKSINYILVLAWVLPIGILLIILYYNFLPFGYEKTLIINVGTEGDDKGEFYLEKNSILGARQSIDGKNFRYLDGLAYAIYEPKAVLKDANIEATVEGKGVSFILPPDLENIAWDYDWNIEGIKKDFEVQTNEQIDYKKDLLINDNCVYFDGTTRLVMPNTFDNFEEGPFAIYAEWIPQITTTSQQIVGHFNWEIMQNEKSITFQAGRMSTSTGPTFKISYPVDEGFFNQKHRLLAIYNPKDEQNINGYVELFVDDIFSGRAYFGDKIIWKDYSKQNLSLGKSHHGVAKYYQGNICHIKIVNNKLFSQTTNKWFAFVGNKITKIPVWGTGELYKIKIKVKK